MQEGGITSVQTSTGSVILPSDTNSVQQSIKMLLSLDFECQREEISLGSDSELWSQNSDHLLFAVTLALCKRDQTLGIKGITSLIWVSTSNMEAHN